MSEQVARSLNPDNARLIADRLRSGQVAGVLVSGGLEVGQDERFLLVEKRGGGERVAHGFVTLSPAVPFPDPSQLSSLTEKVGEELVAKAREAGEPVCFHSVYAADVFPEARPIQRADRSRIPPKAAQDAAKRGLEWRQEHGRGGTEVGVARARDISNGAELSEDTIARMRSFFARHADNSEASGWNEGEDGFPSAGRIAHELWGGDAGKRWADSFADKSVEKAEWTTEYENSLPDSAFLFIESGGEKDDEDKTTPRSLRHLPVYDADGEPDAPHLRAALSRLNQVKTADGKLLSAAKQRQIRDKARRLLDSLKKSVLPKVLTKSAVEEGWMPEHGSGLPASLEATVPESLRYWEMPEEVKKSIRDLLFETGWLNEYNVIEYGGEVVRTVDVVKSHVYVGDGSDFDPLDMLPTSRVDSEKALETGNGEKGTDAISNAHPFYKRLLEPMPIVKAEDREGEWGYVLGEVLSANDGKDGNPLDPDAHNDVISASDLEKVAREYARQFRRFGKMHKGSPLGGSDVRFADSFVLPSGWSIKTDKGYTIDQPTWLLGAEIRKTSQLWKDIQSGKINAWSIDGRGQRVPEMVKP